MRYPPLRIRDLLQVFIWKKSREKRSGFSEYEILQLVVVEPVVCGFRNVLEYSLRDSMIS